MARQKRFKALRRALSYLQPPGAYNPDAPAVQAPPGTQLRKFQDYDGGSVRVSYPRAAGSRPGQSVEKYTNLFGAAITDGVVLVRVSGRANSATGTSGATDALLKLRDTGTTSFEGKFTPANVIINVRTGTGASTPNSKITGREYRKTGSVASYTYPFGRTTGTETYLEVAKAIRSAVDSPTRGVSFLPEDLVTF